MKNLSYLLLSLSIIAGCRVTRAISPRTCLCLGAPGQLPLYGEFKDYYLVGYKNGYGWIAR